MNNMTREEMRFQIYLEAKNYLNPLEYKGHKFYKEAIKIAKELENYIFNGEYNDEKQS